MLYFTLYFKIYSTIQHYTVKCYTINHPFRAYKIILACRLLYLGLYLLEQPLLLDQALVRRPALLHRLDDGRARAGQRLHDLCNARKGQYLFICS